MSKKIKIIGGLILAIVIVEAVLIWSSQVSKANLTKKNASVAEDMQLEDSQEGIVQTNDLVKTFRITGDNFSFSIPEIRVNQGDQVRIEFTSEQGFHDWTIDEFNAQTDQITAGNTTSVEFMVDKKGSFEFYCSVGNHRQLGMVGTLMVE